MEIIILQQQSGSSFALRYRSLFGIWFLIATAGPDGALIAYALIGIMFFFFFFYEGMFG